MGGIIHVFDLPPFIVTLAGMFLAIASQQAMIALPRRSAASRAGAKP